MKKVHLIFLMTICFMMANSMKAQDRLPEYLQAEKFTQEKLSTMLFSTAVDPHWFQQGNNFWYQVFTITVFFHAK